MVDGMRETERSLLQTNTMDLQNDVLKCFNKKSTISNQYLELSVKMTHDQLS